jgi:two-component system sensor histidine kinase KdpD
MSDVVAKVLDFARLQAGARRVQADWHPVEEVIGDALSRMASKLSSHRISTRLPSKLRLAHFDAVLIEQVLVNLLENAAKHTEAESHIDVAAEFMHDELMVTVTDDGPGIPPGDAQLIFDKFHRGSPETAPGGAGLGLAICKVIVEAHGGNIFAENIPAGGAMFRFTIPQTMEQPAIEREAGEDGP